MTVDLIELRGTIADSVVGGVKEVADAFQHMSLLDVGVILIGVGLLAALYVVLRDWRKNKGYRMVLRDRNDKAHALLLEIIQNGLLDAECAGKISYKEVNALYAEMSKKLDLHDLIPKQRMAKITKENLKRKRFGKDGMKYEEWKRSREPKKFATYVGKYRFRKVA